MNFRKFIESEGGLDNDYWTKRLQQFQAAAAGEKGAIDQKAPVQQAATARPVFGARPAVAAGPSMRSLTSQEVKMLGLNPHHQDVWAGSTADAPASYKYVFARMTNKYLTNPNYRA